MRNGLKQYWVVIVLLLTLISCTDPDDDEEGGIIGTGILLEGTVTEQRVLASNTVQIKSQTGEVSNALIDDAGRYQALSVKGDSPYLLRVDLGNDEFRYGIGFNNERANIHSYTDVVLRNWFESNSSSIDAVFDSLVETDASVSALPTRAQYRQNATAFFDIASLVLDSYGITGDQLLSANYDSMSTADGIDAYLRANPVVIQDELISFVITDPKTQTQSTTRSDFAVYELASEQDTQSPEVPTSVKALPSATNEIVIVWEPSSDNRGVAAYEVFRDGELIARTPYPVHIDNDSALNAGRLYTYTVIAVDSSENTSAQSLPAMSSTLAALDITSPPAPVQLSVSSVLGRMELIWGQSQIGDVVSFDVYRGRDNDTPVFLTSVTSTIMTDVSISSGTQYCYQVAAVDASGNESDRSSQTCQVAEGQEVRSVDGSLGLSVPPLAGLSIPDTDNMECTGEWVDFAISESVTISEGCYLVDSDITIENGGNLSLLPGVVLKFGAGIELIAKLGGSLTAVGTAERPVVFTAQDPTPGYWAGILFDDSNSSRNRLVNTVVEYAGGGQEEASVTLAAFSSGNNSRLEVSSSVIRNCLGAGLKVRGENSTLSELDGSVITNCGYPLRIDVQSIEDVTQRNDFTGNDDDWIDLAEAVVMSDVRVIDLGVPYVVDNLSVELIGSMLISAGVEIQFRFGGSFLIDGSVRAEGSNQERITFTGTSAESGHWSGLALRGGLHLESTDILFTGAIYGFSNTESGALYLLPGSVGEYVDVKIIDGASYAINSPGSNIIGNKIDNISVIRNVRTLRVRVEDIQALGSNLVFQNNLNSSIELVGSSSSIKQVVNLFDFGVPYTVRANLDFSSGGLRVHQGVEMYMENNSVIRVFNSAFINLLGTLDEPILLTHISNIPGSWGGLRIESFAGNNSIEHSRIRFAGNVNTGESAAILLQCRNDTALNISHTSIEDSSGWGVFTTRSENCSPTFGENVIMNRNRLGNIGSDL